MRLLTLLPLIASVLCTAASPVEKRLIDAEETILTLDKTAQTLNDGRIALHLTRVDDLLDDKHDNKLLLERVTHIGLTIQLDVASGTLSVNDQVVPMVLPEGEGVSVSIVKAETYSMPVDLPAAFYEAERVQALTDALSVGVAQVSVRLDSEIVKVDALGSIEAQEDNVAIMPVDNVSMRKLGLFVTIDEIEGTTFEHSRTVFAPILQLLVTTQSSDGVFKVKQISTLSVGGATVVAEAVHNNDFLPDVAAMLPAVEPARPKDLPQQLWSGIRAPASGLWSALEGLFGQPRYEHSAALRKKLPAFAPGIRKGLALGPGAPQFDKSLYSEEDGASFGRGHHRHHHQHRKGGCFWKNFSKGFLFIFAAVGYAFTQTLPGILLLSAFAGAVTFHAARRLKKRCAARREALPRYEGDLPDDEYRDEKPPTYASPPAPETNVTIFDADEKA